MMEPRNPDGTDPSIAPGQLPQPGEPEKPQEPDIRRPDPIVPVPMPGPLPGEPTPAPTPSQPEPGVPDTEKPLADPTPIIK